MTHQTIPEGEKDYIVLKDYETAQSLVKNYRGKTLAHKWIIIAPKGLKLVDKTDIAKLPQVKALIAEIRSSTLTEVEGILREEKKKTLWHWMDFGNEDREFSQGIVEDSKDAPQMADGSSCEFVYNAALSAVLTRIKQMKEK